MSYEQLAASVDALSVINADLKNTVLSVQDDAVEARDSSEAFAIEALVSRTQSQTSALESKQAALISETTAQTKVDILRSDLNDPAQGLALVRFMQNFVGATSRPSSEKLRENVSLLDFSDIDPTGENESDASWQKCFDQVAGHNLLIPKGLYIKSARTQVHGNTSVFFEPGATVKRMGAADGWMFVNGEVGNATYANGYDGDGNIHFEGGILDLNGYSGRSAAAFVLGHHKRVSMFRMHMKNGWESHYIEMNSGVHALLDYCIFENQGYEGTGSYECVNIDSANAAGFPGYGTWDLTTNTNVTVRSSVFYNVFGGVSSHGIAAGAAQHKGIKVLDSWFEKIKAKAVRAQGWDDGDIERNTFIDVGEEAVSLLLSNRCRVKNNTIYGASQRTSGSYSAIRIEGDENELGGNIINNDNYTNKYPYAYGIAAGNKNIITTKGAKKGSSALVSNSGTLSNINNRTQLFSGAASGVGTVITLADSITNYEFLEVTTGGVGTSQFQTSIVRPFAARAWAIGTDKLALTSAQGRVTADITTDTSLTLTLAADNVRQIYGVSE